MTRIRLCNNPSPSNHGLDCLLTGSDQRAREQTELWVCNDQPCQGEKMFVERTSNRSKQNK